MIVSVDRYEEYNKTWVPHSYLDLPVAMHLHCEAEELADRTPEDVESIMEQNGAFYYQVVYEERFMYDEEINDNPFKVQTTATFRITPT